MLPRDLLFKAQDNVPNGGVWHRMCFQPSGGFMLRFADIGMALSIERILIFTLFQNLHTAPV